MIGLRYFLKDEITSMEELRALAYLPKLAGRYSKKASFKKSWVRFRSCVKPSGSLGAGEREKHGNAIRTSTKKVKEGKKGKLYP